MGQEDLPSDLFDDESIAQSRAPSETRLQTSHYKPYERRYNKSFNPPPAQEVPPEDDDVLAPESGADELAVLMKAAVLNC